MNSLQILALRDHPELLEQGIDYFASTWGIPRPVYADCISHSLATPEPLPRWYLALRESRIIGSYGLIRNDFISRQDLCPWLCALHVEEDERGKGLGGRLLSHGRAEALRLGFERLYLSTDHVGYYERHGWVHLGTGYGPTGSPSRIYTIGTGLEGWRPTGTAAG